MRQGQQRAPLRGALLLLLILWARSCIPLYAQNAEERGDKKIGDRCTESYECGFNESVCADGKCACKPEFTVHNHLDKCGVPVKVNESCTFNEQCEAYYIQTECSKEGICACRFKMLAVIATDGSIECVSIQTKFDSKEKYYDPAMIIILVVMFLMMITMCVVLRLFSKARWRETRTIFNTPNPRLMNASLLKEHKPHHERRGSKTSKAPSRQPSMASLRAHSPNSQEAGRLFLGSRRGSRGSSNISAASTRSNKSPPQAPIVNSATTPMLECVTVEVQEPKA